MKLHRLLALGLMVSFSAHAAGFSYFGEADHEADAAVAQGGEVSIVGSLEDLMLGATASVATHVTAPPTVQSVQPSVQLAAIAPMQVPAPAVQKVMAKGITDIAPASPEPIVALQSASIQPNVQGKVSPLPVPSNTASLPKLLPVMLEAAVIEPVGEAVSVAPRLKPELRRETRRELAQKPTPAKAASRSARQGAEHAAKRGGEQITAKTGSSNANGHSKAKGSYGGKAASSKYGGVVRARVNRAKRYPGGAGQRGGTAVLRFTVNKSGGVSGASVVRSSGSPVYDREALATLKRAKLPPIPDEIGRASLVFTLPIRFEKG